MIKKINEKEFSSVLQEPAAVIDFSAVWCGPCQMLGPVIQEVSDELAGKASFYNIDVDESQRLAMQYGVMSVPTVLVLKNGKEVAREIGFQPKEALKAKLEQDLA